MNIILQGQINKYKFIIQSLMRQTRHHRITSVQNNKENQFLLNHSNINMNLPCLRNGKVSFKNQFHLNLNKRKKTFINLCTKRQNTGKSNTSKNNIAIKKTAQTTRLASDHTLPTQVSGVYLTSRINKVSYKIINRPSVSQKYKILEKHQINSRMRAKMVDWLLQISQAYKCKSQTFFLAIFLMDQYFNLCERRLCISQLHQIGVTCIYMACKYEEIHHIRMKTIVKDIAHNKISVSDIINRQSQILQVLKFQFQRNCPYLKGQQILNQFLPNLTEQFQLIQQHMHYYFKLASFDPDLLWIQSHQTLAKATILAALRSNPQNQKNLQLYNRLISNCGKEYEDAHHICNQIFFLNLNFKSQFGQLENIQKICPFKASSRPMIQSCAL